MCDRATASLAGLQRNFIDNLAAPFHAGVARLLPRLAPLLAPLADNRRRWADSGCADSDEDLAPVVAAVCDARIRAPPPPPPSLPPPPPPPSP
jgi:hypothetical protein